MPHVNAMTFGPGSLENIELRTWVSRREGGATRMKGKIEGTYTVYCGMGWEHDVDIDIDLGAWSNESDSESLFDAHEGHNAFFFIAQEIEYDLEDWVDPCELEDEL